MESSKKKKSIKEPAECLTLVRGDIAGCHVAHTDGVFNRRPTQEFICNPPTLNENFNADEKKDKILRCGSQGDF